MARKRVPASATLPYHVNARCINREWFNQPMPIVWGIMEDYLRFLVMAYEIEILSFVLMSNHFHLVTITPLKNLGPAMNYFMRETSKRINERTGRINQTYGARFHRSLITTKHHYRHVYKYVYRNPVEAKLVSKIEDYPYSTLHGLLGKSQINIPLAEDKLLFSSPFCQKTLDWLNQAPSREKYLDMKKALRRTVFELPKNKIYRTPNPLETEDF